MSEYIIEWFGIGARITELMGSEIPCLAVKHLREERLREKIVRCRDCKHYGSYDGSSWCCRTYEQVPSGTCDYQTVEPDGFCAWGVRKEVNNDN